MSAPPIADLVAEQLRRLSGLAADDLVEPSDEWTISTTDVVLLARNIASRCGPAHWIPVDDRLPEPLDDVQLLARNSIPGDPLEVIIGYRARGEALVWLYPSISEDISAEVLAWQPLAEAPDLWPRRQP